MWCAQCMQDVPVLREGGKPRCSRCRQALAVQETQPHEDPGQAGAQQEGQPVPGQPTPCRAVLEQELDVLEWQLLQTRCELETIQAVLHREPEDWRWLWASEGYLRWDPRSVAVRGPRRNEPAQGEEAPAEQSAAETEAPAASAWARYLGELLIYVAAMFFSLGAVLGAWAHWGGREQFWPIAWPALAGSAAGLLLGVLLRAWAGPAAATPTRRTDSAEPIPQSRRVGGRRADSHSLHTGPHWSPAVHTAAELPWQNPLDATAE